MKTPRIGDRVKLRCEVTLYPLGTFPEGTIGTVTDVYDDRGKNPARLAGEIKLDDRFECLDDWDNTLQVFHEPEVSITWAAFENLGSDIW
jgi:hypothetical protein